MAWMNGPSEHAGKFWRLAAIKVGLMVSLVAIALGERFLLAAGAIGAARLVIVLQAGLALYYAPVMMSNWRICARSPAGVPRRSCGR